MVFNIIRLDEHLGSECKKRRRGLRTEPWAPLFLEVREMWENQERLCVFVCV